MKHEPTVNVKIINIPVTNLFMCKRIIFVIGKFFFSFAKNFKSVFKKNNFRYNDVTTFFEFDEGT